MFSSPDEVLLTSATTTSKYVDVRFCDLPGVMQHFTIPASTFGEDIFANGLGFDGSSIRGFQAIHESDMLLLPDADSAYLDPFRAQKTLNVNFFIHDPITARPTAATRATWPRRPRRTSRAAASPTPRTSAPEAEFYVFDSCASRPSINAGYYHIDSGRGLPGTPAATERGRPQPGLQDPGYKGGYFPVAPVRPLRRPASTDDGSNLTNAGLERRAGHHEVGTAGQAEINYKFDTLLRSADS